MQMVSVGEAVLAVGGGWGPPNLREEQLSVLLEVLSHDAAAVNADVTVLRRRASLGAKGSDGAGAKAI